MISSLLGSTGFVIFALGAWTIALVFAIGRLDRIVPRGSRAEDWVRRWMAAGQSLVLVGAVLSVILVLFKTDTTTWRWLTVGVLLVVAWASRRALSDWVNGVTLRTEGTLRVGGRIAVGKGRGRIRRLGLRSAEVEAEDGRVLRLPYTGLAEVNIEISSEEVAARSHTFSIEADEADGAELKARLITGALLSSWSSAQPLPTVRMLEPTDGRARVEVTVYPVDPASGGKVEEAVRQSVQREGAAHDG